MVSLVWEIMSGFEGKILRKELHSELATNNCNANCSRWQQCQNAGKEAKRLPEFTFHLSVPLHHLNTYIAIVHCCDQVANKRSNTRRGCKGLANRVHAWNTYISLFRCLFTTHSQIFWANQPRNPCWCNLRKRNSFDVVFLLLCLGIKTHQPISPLSCCQLQGKETNTYT